MDWIIVLENCNDCIYDFAAGELQSYINQTTGKSARIVNKPHAGNAVFLKPQHEASEDDRFSIYQQNNMIILEGSNRRSILFAAYAFIEKYLGVRWYYPGEDTLSPKQKNDPIPAPECRTDIVASFRDRGLTVEARMGAQGYCRLIDWMAKNKMNNIALPFQIWDEFKSILAPEIIRRGMKLTLSGHSYFNFVPVSKYYDGHKEWFALHNGQRIKNGQLCLSNPDMHMEFCRNVLAYLESQPVPVSRLSIWPADNRLYCECENCRRKSFIANYAELLNNLRKSAELGESGVAIEHLAYNAGLSDEMIMPPVTESSSIEGLDTLFAYWGRNYADPIDDPSSPGDLNARRHIRDWAALHTNKRSSLSVLEYYTDFWMLTSIYPPLGMLIGRDLKFYRSAGVSGIFSLIVACEYGCFKEKNYPWEWIMGLNMYIFAASSVNVDTDISGLLKEYFKKYYGTAYKEAEFYFSLLEKLLPQLTSFNIPLFRLRFPDVWEFDKAGAEGGTEFAPGAWTADCEYSEAEVKRDEICKKIYSELQGVSVSADDNNGNIVKARYYFSYIKDKIEALHYQLEAKKYLRNHERDKARPLLEKAIAIEDRLYKENVAHCQAWL